MSKKKSLFDILNDLSFTKIKYEPDIPYNNYMINRFISMCATYIPIVNEVNKGKIPEEVHYNFYRMVLPKNKTFFKYIGKSKDSEEDKLVIESLMEYFKIGRKDAERYYEILPEEGRNEILGYYHSEIKKSSTKKKARSAGK